MSWRAYLGAAVFGVSAGLLIGYLSSCTPAHQATANQATVTGVRIAACVQSVLAEEERARMLERREAERLAEEEAEAIKDAAREHSPTTAEEVEKVLR